MDDTDPPYEPLVASWFDAWSAQLQGDHARAEALFAELAEADPSDAEARFEQAISAGWAAPDGEPRFDEVVVGIAVALERATPGERTELRRRGARALVVLAEATFESSEASLPPSPPRQAIARHVTTGLAALRLLDAALELDPHTSSASEAIVRTCDDLLSRARRSGGLRMERASNLRDLEARALVATRERALRHLVAIAGGRPSPPPIALRVRATAISETHERETLPAMRRSSAG